MWRYLITIFLLFLSFCLAHAATVTEFDVKQANGQFDRINLQLSVQNLNLNHLLAAVNTLSKLTNEADQCVDEAQKRLGGINTLIQQGRMVDKDSQHNGVDLVYLGHEQKKLMNRQAQCRLFSIRAKEAIEAYKSAISQFKAEQTLAHDMPLWSMIGQFINNTTLTSLMVNDAVKWPSLSLKWLVSMVGLAVVLSSLLLFSLYQSNWIRAYVRFKQVTVRHVLLLASFLFVVFLALYQQIFFEEIEFSPFWSQLFLLIGFYFGSLVLVILLSKVKKIRAFFHWNALNQTFFKVLIMVVLSFYVLFKVAQLLITTLSPGSLVTQLSLSIFLLGVLLTGVYLLHFFCRAHQHLSFISHHARLIRYFGSLLLSVFGIVNCLGYQALAIRATFSSLMTVSFMFVMAILTHGLTKLYQSLTQHTTTRRQLQKYFGYKKDQMLTEFLILKTTMQFIVVMTGLFFIGKSWDFATDVIDKLNQLVFDGVHFSNMVIYPGRMVLGLIIFCLVYLVFRSLSTAISRYHRYDEDDEETQVALASLLNYSGFAVAVLVGLLVAGFNFTGLAIVAGALSVGIGLGLQSIVNNFVSGLILLIEKPIKPGDRINVDGIEGFVKKIQVRSTQLISPYREDIIIPNSDLITRRVTNYMFSDKFGRINCEVGVAYESDTEKVREILLAVAYRHDEIVKTGPLKPLVLFRSFGESKLVFQLWCLIMDVNNKSIVQSDINFAIDKAFREHKICIAVSSQNIHISLDESMPLIHPAE